MNQRFNPGVSINRIIGNTVIFSLLQSAESKDDIIPDFVVFLGGFELSTGQTSSCLLRCLNVTSPKSLIDTCLRVIISGAKVFLHSTVCFCLLDVCMCVCFHCG